jgi:ElaA protein
MRYGSVMQPVRPGQLQPREWRVKAFAELTVRELYALLQLRQEVFVVEQRCAYRDADGLDLQARHLFAVERQAAGEGPLVLGACARLFAPGLRGDEAVIGRVVSAPALRKSGVGRELMTRAIELCGLHTPIRIGAQQYLERFYRSFGFERAGEDYLEDDIPHLPMVRRGK